MVCHVYFFFFLLSLYFSLLFPIPLFFLPPPMLSSFKFFPLLSFVYHQCFFYPHLCFFTFFPLLSHSFNLVFCFLFIFSLFFPSHFFIFSSFLNFYLLQLQHLPLLSISTFPFLFNHLSYSSNIHFYLNPLFPLISLHFFLQSNFFFIICRVLPAASLFISFLLCAVRAGILSCPSFHPRNLVWL